MVIQQAQGTYGILCFVSLLVLCPCMFCFCFCFSRPKPKRGWRGVVQYRRWRCDVLWVVSRREFFRLASLESGTWFIRTFACPYLILLSNLFRFGTVACPWWEMACESVNDAEANASDIENGTNYSYKSVGKRKAGSGGWEKINPNK